MLIEFFNFFIGKQNIRSYVISFLKSTFVQRKIKTDKK